MTSNPTHHLTIPADYEGERLDQVLAKLLPQYSRTQIKDWIDNGAILVDGAVVKAKTKVKGNEEVSITAIPKPQPAWEAQEIPLNIVYEDDDLLVINKPAGLVVHPGAGNADRTMLNALIHHVPALSQLPRAGILHRLDKDTSGLLVIAKTAEALRHLSLQLKERTILREYKAVVYGTMISGGQVDAPVGRHPLQRKRMAVVDSGRPALTHYRIGEKFRHLTLLTLRLETGRTHQIRVHMTHIHHPLVGDTVYGGRVQLSKGMTPELIEAIRHFKRQALHAFALGFEHPTTGEMMKWEAPIPADMEGLLNALRADAKSK